MMFMIAKPKNSPFSLFQTINGVCVMNTSAVYPSSNEEGNAGDWEKLWTLLKVWTPQKSSTPEEPGSLNRKTSTSRPSLEPQNPDSGILKVGFSFEPLKKRVVSANNGSRICPNLPQFLAVSTRNLHTILIWWSFIIIWSLYDHHRIIIWSQRLDVIKKKRRRWIFKI